MDQSRGDGMLKIKNMIFVVLVFSLLCSGCTSQTKEDNLKKPADTPQIVGYYHDEYHRVSCWVTSFAMHCLPDGSISNGG